MDSINRKFDKNKISQRKSNKKYKKTEKGKAATHRAKQKYQKTIKYIFARKIANNNYRARHPIQIKAQRTVNNAIADGKLRRPDSLICHYCPEQAKQYHHHKGYEPKHWLDIVPTCTRCHRKSHRKIA